MLTLKLYKNIFGVCKLDANKLIPKWAKEADWYSITKTEDELSIVCSEDYIPRDIESEKGWRCFKIEGILDFNLVGILSSLSTLMANEKISIFAISTFNTDYILVKEDKVEKAILIFKNSDINIILE